jgi:ABC-type transport system involved in cytochrome c biogenesis permease subunit
LLIGLIVNMLTLLMTNISSEMLDKKIGPLVPVLRSNFWLSTHVTTIIISYGAFALSWLIGNISLVKKHFFNYALDEDSYYADLIYLCLKFGVVFLAAGILFGAIWADYAWGRFWGWDPKETWSLIVLLIYMIIIHGKYTSWVLKDRFIHLSTAAFMSVIMAWFGVNYILASGLHSYGFRSGGTIFVVLFFILQIIVLVAVLLKSIANKGK